MKTMSEIKLNTSNVRFLSETHQYFLGDKELFGITNTLIKRAYPDTYKDIPQHILEQAARNGSLMHETIELYDELGIESDLKELANYKKVLKENNLQVLASEYIVSDNEHYATAIDKVMQDADGNIILIDLKRTSVLHTENVSLQLSICKRFFEILNPHIKVHAIYVLRLRDNISELVKLAPVSDEFIDELIASDILGTPFFSPQVSRQDSLPKELSKVENEISHIESLLKKYNKKQEELKSGLLSVMEEHGVKSWTGNKIKITRSLPSNKTTFDSKRFADEHPELYKQYCRESTVSGGLRITILKDKNEN